MSNLNVRITSNITSDYHRKNAVSNNSAWKRRTDDWIRTQEQSNKIKRLRKNPELRDLPMNEVRQLIHE
ncbi:hypothetical protein TDB9533_03984 [Thalassocella blandensis]|nr:hypothetical protein TDB9533_03984 [Thalassocella blandensis]